VNISHRNPNFDPFDLTGRPQDLGTFRTGERIAPPSAYVGFANLTTTPPNRTLRSLVAENNRRMRSGRV